LAKEDTMATATLDPTALEEEQTEAAADAARAFLALLQDGQPVVELRTTEDDTVTVPAPAFRLFVAMLTHLANGDGVVLMPEHAELSTQQAADMLNVSRPYVIKLIDDKQLPARKVGTHRRVLLRDLLEYKRRDDAEREAVMQELADQAQELGLGY
jgi:excisionase family DNA binding protein